MIPSLTIRRHGALLLPVFFLLLPVFFVVACASEPRPVTMDPALATAIGWYTGVGVSEVSDLRARESLEEALADPDPLSTMWLARVHSTGRMGYERDRDKAKNLAAGVIEEIEAAAGNHLAEAVFLMGTAYDEGLGKEENADSATAWHRRAAEMGHVLGEHNLGNAYRSGRGVPVDLTLAVEWWTKAAEKGDAITQLRLGEAYEAGDGVAQDLVQSRMWYAMAAAVGNAAAAEALVRMDIALDSLG